MSKTPELIDDTLKTLEEARAKEKAEAKAVLARTPSTIDALELRVAALFSEEARAMLPEVDRDGWALLVKNTSQSYREESARIFRESAQVLRRVLKDTAARERAESLFNEITNEIGIDRTREIFSQLARPPTKQKIEEAKNVELLELYIQMKWPVQRLARFLAEANKRFPKRFGARSGTWEAIEKQLWRLIKTAPSEARPGRMRVLIKEAAKVHQETEIKPGRPKLNK